jgi:hypothetical protein
MRTRHHIGLSVLSFFIVTFVFAIEARADPITITIVDPFDPI